MPVPSDEPGAMAIEKPLGGTVMTGPHGGGDTYSNLEPPDTAEEAMLAWLIDTQNGIYG